MKKHLTTLVLIILFIAFSLFNVLNSRTKTVLNVITPDKIAVDMNNDKSTDNNEIICLEGVETFSLEPSEKFYNKYSKSLKLSRNEMIALGYLAQDYAQKTILNSKVRVKLTGKITTECKYAKIKINGTDYSKILENSGFGIINDKPGNIDKFKHNLEQAKKLHLVTLNHHSGKFHTLDCPYGNAAHDKVIIPKNQLPENVVPCKFCHNSHTTKKVFTYKKDKNIFNIPKIIQPPLQVSDGDIKVYYTDFSKNLKPSNSCNSEVCQQLVTLINSASSTIDIAIYGYSEIPAITQALKNAKNKGVTIRFVYDGNFDSTKDYYKDNKIIAELASVHRSDKTESKTQSNMLMHNKFVIFDNKTVYTGSMNFSPTGTSAYDVNNVVIINSKNIAELYTKEFEQMLGGKFHNKKESITQNNRFLLGNSEIEVYFSPKDKSASRIVQLIKDAKTYIYIPTFLITHTDITNELINAHNRGVDVRIIIDANSTGTRNSKHGLLRRSGILLKTENYAGKLHAKTMILDDKYLITGSMNFSNSGENKNDENLLIIKNPKIAKAHKNFFLYLWTIIPSKYLKYNARSESP
ncbi:MAG: hypothetical protein K2F57_05410, partial [Candidatus Gastranaerophilales bacterium]|nr:hypothetical protein [Candidatus Gastranaerophilales bacterium]